MKILALRTKPKMIGRRKLLGLAAKTAGVGAIAAAGVAGLSRVVSAKRPVSCCTADSSTSIISSTGGHPYVYAADFYNGSWDDAIEASIDKAHSSEKGVVELPPGRLQLSRTIFLPPAVMLRGRGSQLSPNPGTTLDFANMASGNGVIFGADAAGYNHGSGLERLQIRDAPEHAVYIDVRIGEEFILDGVRVMDAGGDGFHFTKQTSGSTPVDLGHLAAFRCDRGLFMQRTFQRTGAQIRYISGDNNRSALMMFKEGDVSGTLKLGGWKCEVRGGRFTQPVAIHIVDGNSAMITIGQGTVFTPFSQPPTGEAIVINERVNGGTAKLTLEGIGMVEGAKNYFATGLKWSGHPDISVAGITRRYWSNKPHEFV